MKSLLKLHLLLSLLALSLAQDDEMFKLVNQLRKSRGVQPLCRSPQLDQAASRHSAAMQRDGMSHFGPSDGGLQFNDRISAAGFVAVNGNVAENIAQGQKTVADAYKSFYE